MRIRTPNFPVWSKKTTSGHFRPCTGAINTTLVKEARVARWLEGATSLFTCRPAYQMSADGVTWGTVTGIGALSATAGWVYDDGPVTSITTDQQLFVRFGVEGANVSGALVQQGTCALDLDLRPVVGGSLAASEVKVFTSGSTSTRVFHPLLSGVAFEDITELRSTVQVESGSGAILAAINDEAESPGFSLGREFQEVHLETIGRENRILRRIRRVIVAEPARNAPNGENDVVVAVGKTKPCMSPR